MIVLSNVITADGPYEGKSKFKFWSNIQKSDELIISMDLKPTGHSRGKIYAPFIKVTNTRTGEEFSETINRIQDYLSKLPKVLTTDHLDDWH